jgi:hypothetical protein
MKRQKTIRDRKSLLAKLLLRIAEKFLKSLYEN